MTLAECLPSQCFLCQQWCALNFHWSWAVRVCQEVLLITCNYLDAFCVLWKMVLQICSLSPFFATSQERCRLCWHVSAAQLHSHSCKKAGRTLETKFNKRTYPDARIGCQHELPPGHVLWTDYQHWSTLVAIRLSMRKHCGKETMLALSRGKGVVGLKRMKFSTMCRRSLMR